MSVTTPAFIIPRKSLVGYEGEWVKMFDPPTVSPATPENLELTKLPAGTRPNPVPDVMAAAGYQKKPSVPYTVIQELLKSLTIPTWDGKNLAFFAIGDSDNPTLKNGTYPGGIVRVPRGAIFHGKTVGQGPPPHTIHWHGIEPTPINDGVGHCSMEIGTYIYQWQANFIGTYFYHCHRNTPQHFEYGLFSMLPVMPSDAYFATQRNPVIPIGAGRDGKFRTAANVADFKLPDGSPMFPGFKDTPGHTIDVPDPWTGDPALKFETDPHAMTVPYDVEAIWVPDDRDSIWSDLAVVLDPATNLLKPDAKITFPKHGGQPGVDDQFHERPGLNGFFALNDFNADYWFITGVAVPANRGGTAAIPAGIVLPPAMNSGVSGSQVSINAKTGQTILVRCLDAAYNNVNVTFPVDAVIIAWDGRALGVAPFNQYNHAYLVPANTPIHFSVARRFDALIRATTPINDFAMVEFLDTRNGTATGHEEVVLMTAKIPINIVAGGEMDIKGTVTDKAGAPLVGVTMKLTGALKQKVVTDDYGNYGITNLVTGKYEVKPSLEGYKFEPEKRKVAYTLGHDVLGVDFTGTKK